ncbi:hypothetical protein KM043_005159 [Ampulex compressa]|nr:hypothetical protein KM043_005159 [Ampulex compressa]
MLTLLLFASLAAAQDLSPRIIGGSAASIDNYPYQVSIHYNGALYCGGSIISDQWILTAAHCVYGKKAANFEIRLESSYHGKDGKLVRGITTMIFHEYYDEDSHEYDIALIKLPKPIAWSSKAKPVSLANPTTNPAAGSSAIVTGWGKTSVGGGASSVLQILKVPLVDQKTCQKIYQYKNPVTPQMLCAGYLAGNKDTCQGDSGGPLVYNGVQIGIVSWGAECARAGYPGVYARVSALRSWITKRAGV